MFADPGSNWMISIQDLHDRIIFYLIIILAVVVWFTISSMIPTADHLQHLTHGNMIELIWTITPALILWLIGLPSQRLLYLMDAIVDPELTIKVMGSQWYWCYEYSNYSNYSIDSFLSNDMEIGDLRQLNVDNFLILPINTTIRQLVSSNDVIHSFALPNLAIKIDAIPGRLNSAGLIINRSSTFYGQCSELCGVLHGFMPIGVHAVNLVHFISLFNHPIINLKF